MVEVLYNLEKRNVKYRYCLFYADLSSFVKASYTPAIEVQEVTHLLNVKELANTTHSRCARPPLKTFMVWVLPREWLCCLKVMYLKQTACLNCWTIRRCINQDLLSTGRPRFRSVVSFSGFRSCKQNVWPPLTISVSHSGGGQNRIPAPMLRKMAKSNNFLAIIHKCLYMRGWSSTPRCTSYFRTNTLYWW